MNKNNFYVAFSVHVYPYAHIQGSDNLDVTDRYGDLHVYWKDTGRMESLYHITYNQLYETYRHYSNGCEISLIPITPKGNYLDPRYCSFLWEHMNCIIDWLFTYVHGDYVVLDKQQNDSKLLSHTEYLGDKHSNTIRDHRSLLITDYDYGRHLYIGGLTATQLHDHYEELQTLSLTYDDWCEKRKNFVQFITTIINTMDCWKYTSFDEFHKNIWDYYCNQLDRTTIAHEILDGENKDRSLSQDIVIQKYDENPVIFKNNVDELVDEVNHNYDLLQANLKTTGFELKKITKDESPSEMDELMNTCEYLRKNIAVSFVKMPETRGDYKITLCNINDPSGIIYKCPDEITVKSVRENLKPESKGSRFYKLFSTVKDMYTDLKCEYIPATDIMGYISSEYNRTVMCSAQLPVATRQIKSDLFKIVLNAFPVTYNGKDDLEFTITLYHVNTGVVYIIILPGQLFTASQVLEYTKSLQDYRDMIHDPIRSQKTKIFETRILDLLRTASEDFNMNDVMELIYGAYAISVNHRIKNW